MSSRRGHDRERRVVDHYLKRDWWAMRAPASLGDVDVVALKNGHRPHFVEVKSTAGGPFERFGPKDRADLLWWAELAGAEAWLCWWPPRRDPVWIPAHQFPGAPSVRAAA